MFLYSDLSGIEARTWRWLVGSPSLQMFAEKDKGGPDPYVVTAAKTFVIPISGVTDELRQVGKVLCLLSQYQGGPGKIVGATGVSLEFAEQAIAAFRKSEPQMVNAWANMNKAFKSVLTGERPRVTICNGKLAFVSVDKTTVAMRLPSGRHIYYNKCRILTKDLKVKSKTLRRGSIVYIKHDGETIGYYGGVGAENSASGMARDVMAAAMLKCEQSELPICHHAHDSLMVELRESEASGKVDLLNQIMCTPPPWAAGLPLSSPVKVLRRMP